MVVTTFSDLRAVSHAIIPQLTNDVLSIFPMYHCLQVIDAIAAIHNVSVEDRVVGAIGTDDLVYERGSVIIDSAVITSPICVNGYNSAQKCETQITEAVDRFVSGDLTNLTTVLLIALGFTRWLAHWYFSSTSYRATARDTILGLGLSTNGVELVQSHHL